MTTTTTSGALVVHRYTIKSSNEGTPSQKYFHYDGNPLDGENQARDIAGILKKIGGKLLNFRINRLKWSICDKSPGF